MLDLGSGSGQFSKLLPPNDDMKVTLYDMSRMSLVFKVNYLLRSTLHYIQQLRYIVTLLMNSKVQTISSCHPFRF